MKKKHPDHRPVTLIILAAGLGSRFGGPKQTEPIDGEGHTLLEYSIYDAVRAGFDDICIVVSPTMAEQFKKTVGARIEREQGIKVRYVVQSLDGIPLGRKKPWGPAHAVLCCKEYVKGPFSAIYADDYYGRETYRQMYLHLAFGEKNECVTVGYRLSDTLNSDGSVNRTACNIKDGKLVSVSECRGVQKDGAYAKNGFVEYLDPSQTTVTCWGFAEDYFAILESEFQRFLKRTDLQTAEFILPDIVQRELQSETPAHFFTVIYGERWFGFTNHADLDKVKNSIAEISAQYCFRNHN